MNKHTPARTLTPTPPDLTLSLSLTSACLLACAIALSGCEGGVEPPALYVGGVESSEPVGGVNTTPTPTPKLREDCGPLLPEARDVFVGPAPIAPAAVLKNCKNCHVAPSPGNNFVIPELITNTTLSPQDIQAIYEAVSPFVTLGAGAESALTLRLSDGHSNISRYTPDSPEVTAMTAWIDALTLCP